MSNHEGFSDPTADLAVGRAARTGRKGKPEKPGRGRGRPLNPVRKEAKVNSFTFTRKFPLPIVYICSPFAADAEEAASRDLSQDRLKAKRFSRFAVSRCCVPVAPHLLYPAFLRDDVKPERRIGNYCSCCLLDKCSELWVCGDEMTPVMEEEIRWAYLRGIRIRFFTEDMKEVAKELPDACRIFADPENRSRKKGGKAL